MMDQKIRRSDNQNRAYDLKFESKVIEWLQFIDGPLPATADELLRLEVLLDQFASVRIMLGDLEGLSCSAGSPTPPRSDQDTLRKQIIARFPMLGLYNIPERVTDRLMQCGLMLGDAVDDMLDITNELRASHWLMEQGHIADAQWHFAFGYDHHWRYHTRCLLWYLEMRRFEAP